MGSSSDALPNHKDLEEIHSPLLKDGVQCSDDLACALSGCGLSDAKNREDDARVRSSDAKKLGIAVVLCLMFIAVEVTGGLISHSLAVLTDAAHLLSDVAGFAISLFAIWASGWEATPRQSYGFFRLEILGALLSIQLIWLLTGIIVYEAIYRMIHPNGQVDGQLMFLVATFGFFVNVIMVCLLGHRGHSHSHDGHDHGHDHACGHAHDHSSRHLPSILKRTDGEGDENLHDHDGHEHEHEHEHDHLEHSGSGRHILTQDLGYLVYEDGRRDSYKVDMDITTGNLHDHDGHEHEHEHDHLEHSDSGRHILTQDLGDLVYEDGRRDSYKVDMDITTGNTGDTGNSKGVNINVKGAWLHVLGDLIQSIGVMIGGAIIWVKPEWKVVDLICTLFFSVIVLGTTIKILRDIMEVLMESTPREIDTKKLEKGLCEIAGVIAIHDLHIWAITLGKTLLACHVTIYSDADADAVLQRVIGYCNEVFNISHVTFQIERERRRSLH